MLTNPSELAADISRSRAALLATLLRASLDHEFSDLSTRGEVVSTACAAIVGELRSASDICSACGYAGRSDAVDVADLGEARTVMRDIGAWVDGRLKYVTTEDLARRHANGRAVEELLRVHAAMLREAQASVEAMLPPLVTVPTFRDTMSTWVSGVTVVTTRTPDGMTQGLTVSSFASVSLEPLLILVCLRSGHSIVEHIQAAGIFAVNVLAEDQEAMARHFATRGLKPGGDAGPAEYIAGRFGAPLFRGAVARFECALTNVVGAGDHAITIGQVLAADQATHRSPLTYSGRTYRALGSPLIEQP